MVKPFTPEDAEANKKKIPDAVLNAVNALLAERYSGGGTVVIKQEEVIERALPHLDCSRHEMFDRHYLDFEGVYKRAGWRVKYDKPGYNESYGAFWEFSKARGHDRDD